MNARTRIALRFSLIAMVLFVCSAWAAAQQLGSIVITPDPMTGGGSATGTVTLTKAAKSPGLTIGLSSSSTAATLPATVTVAAGATKATFVITASHVAVATKSTIKGTDPTNKSISVLLTINPPAVRVTGLTISPASVTAGHTATGTVTLSANAPSGGVSLGLTTAQSFIKVPASVSVKAGTKSATFTVQSVLVTTAGPATVTATDMDGYTAAGTVTVNVPSVRLTALSISPTTVNSNSSATGTVTLSAAAPAAGLTVTLTSPQAFASVPAHVVVASGATSATFTVTTGNVSSTSTATINGSDPNGYLASTVLTVNAGTSSGSTVSMTDTFSFSPQTITVAAGSTVTWTNNSSFMNHTVTPDVTTAGMSSDGQFPQGVPPGKSFSWTVPANAKSGTAFYYHCRFHGSAGNGKSLGSGMAGVVIVK